MKRHELDLFAHRQTHVHQNLQFIVSFVSITEKCRGSSADIRRSYYLSCTYKWTVVLVNILLVNFISEQNQFLLVTELYYFFQIAFTKALSSRISGVYDHHSAYLVKETERVMSVTLVSVFSTIFASIHQSNFLPVCNSWKMLTVIPLVRASATDWRRF